MGFAMSLLLRVLVGFVAVLAMITLIVWLNFDSVRYSAVMWVGTPSRPFSEARPFDYATPEAWASLPTATATQKVDVFLVHGTTYYRPYNDSWNHPADDAETNAIVSQNAILAASLYGDCCKLYLPRYRQAIIGAIADDKNDGDKAIALAYRDVERAFDYYISHHNNRRPFMLAGASQGGRHIFALLKNRISGTELRDRMVAAYPLIWWMKKNQFAKESPDIPICSEPTQNGCVVTFNPVGPHLRTGLNPIFDQTGIICVNPLTWRTDGAYAGFELNLGARPFRRPDKLIPGAADARCDENGRLLVSKVRANMYEGVPLPLQLVMGLFGHDNYHPIAGGLFFTNLKRNIGDRAEAYLTAHPSN
jgi:Protein of unknown function (DUF3089)